MDQYSDQRHLHRHPINGEITAYVRGTEHKVGKLVNAHREGLLLDGSEVLVPDKVYPLKLTMAGEMTMPWISVDVKCLWVAAIGDSFRAGCVIVDIEPEALEVLRQLDL